MQKQNYYITKKTNQIIVFLISLMYVICPKAPWTYSQCSDYLNNLDINCKIVGKNGKGEQICKKVNFPVMNVPNECFNQIYKLQVNFNDSNKQIKKLMNLFLKINDDLTGLNNIEGKFDLNKKVEECYKNYIIYHKKCLNDKFYENEDYCKELEKLKDSYFCKYAVDEIRKKVQDKSIFELKDKISLDFGTVKFEIENDDIYYSFEVAY